MIDVSFDPFSFPSFLLDFFPFSGEAWNRPSLPRAFVAWSVALAFHSFPQSLPLSPDIAAAVGSLP